MACSFICEKTFLLISMPGLEICLSCVLLFICLCTIKDCSCVKCVHEEKKIKGACISCYSVDCQESTSVAAMVASGGLNTRREPIKVQWSMFI